MIAAKVWVLMVMLQGGAINTDLTYPDLSSCQAAKESIEQGVANLPIQDSLGVACVPQKIKQ